MFLSCKSKGIFGNMPYLKNTTPIFINSAFMKKIYYSCVPAQMHTTHFPWALYTAGSFSKVHFSGVLASCRDLKVYCSAEEPGGLPSSLSPSSGVPETAVASLLGATDPTVGLWLQTLVTAPPVLFLPPLLGLIARLAVPCVPFISYQVFAASSHIKFLILNYLVWTVFLAGP